MTIGGIDGRVVAAAVERRIDRPRHPRQELGLRGDDGVVDGDGVARLDRLEHEPLGFERYSLRGGAGVPAFAGPIQTVWMFVNSLIPNSDSSRP